MVMHSRSRFLALSVPLFLAACAGATQEAATPSLHDNLRNPLYADRYWSEMVDRLTMLQIQSGAVLRDPKKAQTAETVKQDALKRSQEISAEIRKGLSADFVSIDEQVEGRVLLLDGTLYFGSNFVSYPGPALRVYLSDALDPRSRAFPGPSDVDLGILENPYGTQSYALPEAKKDGEYRTVVLWDRRLGRLYAFAQLG